MFFRTFFIRTMACLLVTGCASVPVSTMWKLRNFDLIETDARKLRVGVRMPNHIRLKPGDVNVMVKLLKKGRTEETSRLDLSEVTDAKELAGVSTYRKSGFSVTVYRLTEGALKKLSVFKAQFRQQKKRFGDDVSGQMSVTTTGCVKPGFNNRPVLVTTLFKSSETGSFVVLTAERDISKLLRQAGSIKPCQD